MYIMNNIAVVFSKVTSITGWHVIDEGVHHDGRRVTIYTYNVASEQFYHGSAALVNTALLLKILGKNRLIRTC